MVHSSPIPLRLRRPPQSTEQQSQLSPSLPYSSESRSTTLNIQHVVLGSTILTPTVEGEFPSSLVHPLDGSNNTSLEQDATGEHRETKARAEWLFVCEKCCKYEIRPEVYRAHVRFCPGWGDEECEVPIESKKRKRSGRRVSGEEAVEEEEGRGHPRQRRLVFKGRGGEEVYEVDGKKEKLFAQCLSALASCFIESKSVSFDVEAFLFYVLYIPVKDPGRGDSDSDSGSEAESASTRRKRRAPSTSKPRTRTTIKLAPKQPQQMKLAGYFSKEKKSWDEFNLACILVFPQYQGLGLGRLLVELSYELTLRAYHAAVAARSPHESSSRSVSPSQPVPTPLTATIPPPPTGTDADPSTTTILTPSFPWGAPEKPLSASAERMYRSFWHSRISAYIHSLLPASTNPRKTPAGTVTVRTIAANTGIAPEDVIGTLREWEAVLREGDGEEAKLVVEKVPVRKGTGSKRRWGVAEGWVAEPILVGKTNGA